MNSFPTAIPHRRPSFRQSFPQKREDAFAARVLIPPELVVTPVKRYLSGEITDKRILELVKNYQPEQLLLRGSVELKDRNWISWTTNHYVLVDREGDRELWVSRLLNPKGIPKEEGRLHNLGL